MPVIDGGKSVLVFLGIGLLCTIFFVFSIPAMAYSSKGAKAIFDWVPRSYTMTLEAKIDGRNIRITDTLYCGKEFGFNTGSGFIRYWSVPVQTFGKVDTRKSVIGFSLGYPAYYCSVDDYKNYAQDEIGFPSIFWLAHAERTNFIEEYKNNRGVSSERPRKQRGGHIQINSAKFSIKRNSFLQTIFAKNKGDRYDWFSTNAADRSNYEKTRVDSNIELDVYVGFEIIKLDIKTISSLTALHQVLIHFDTAPPIMDVTSVVNGFAGSRSGLARLEKKLVSAGELIPLDYDEHSNVWEILSGASGWRRYERVDLNKFYFSRRGHRTVRVRAGIDFDNFTDNRELKEYLNLTINFSENFVAIRFSKNSREVRWIYDRNAQQLYGLRFSGIFII